MAHRLLLADDSITIQKVVELTLSEEDFDVTAVGDGEAALDAAKKAAPDIILADVFMPKMDGYQLCGRLKQDPALRDIPVILLAGTFEDYDEAMAARVGADDHLTKPFESAELISMVKRLVEKRGAPRPAAPQTFQAEPVEEAFLAEEVMEAAPADSPESDDLWSVVDMQSEEQPLADATAILSEEDLWKRANLTSAPGQKIDIPGPEEDMPWDAVPAPAEPEEAGFIDAGPLDEEVYPSVSLEDEDAPAEATAILNMDDLGGPSFMEAALEAEPEPVYMAEPEPAPEPEPIELAEVSPDIDGAQIYTFDSLQDASFAADFVPKSGPAIPAAQAQPAPAAGTPAVSIEAIREAVREEVAMAVSQALDARIRQAVAALGRDAIEQVVWEVVPDLAEEILVKEIEKLKAGI